MIMLLGSLRPALSAVAVINELMKIGPHAKNAIKKRLS
jgi:hypothetical protein